MSIIISNDLENRPLFTEKSGPNLADQFNTTLLCWVFVSLKVHSVID